MAAFRFFTLFVFVTFFVNCSGPYERLVSKADQEAIKQKSQLAQYLYIQVIENHKAKDNIRFRALKVLANVSMSQLFDYPAATKALGILFDEYSSAGRYKSQIAELRVKNAQIWRISLKNPQKALDVLSPLMKFSDIKEDAINELAQSYMGLSEYDQAQKWFVNAWERAKEKHDCESLKRIQLDIIQVYSLRNMCDEALKWSNETFPKGCYPEHFGVAIEKAHCYEMTGEVNKALSLYLEIIKKDPTNAQAHFFLDSLKERQKEKQSK